MSNARKAQIMLEPDKRLIPEEVHQRAQQQALKEKEEQEALAKKNHNFLQVQKSSLKEFRRLIKENATAAQLMFVFAEKMNRQNALMCSFKTLEQITGLSRSTLSKAITLLRKEQWIEVIKIGTANAYMINHQVFWQDSADRRESSFTFGATIIASRSEQDPEMQSENWKGVSLRHFPFLQGPQMKDITDEAEIVDVEAAQKMIAAELDSAAPTKTRGRPKKKDGTKPTVEELEAAGQTRICD